MNNHLLSRFSQDNTRLTPWEIVHLPEGIQRQEEGERRDSEDVKDHPSNHVPFAPHNEDQCLHTINRGDHNQWERWDGFAECRNQVDEVDDLQPFVSKHPVNSTTLSKLT
jgi:hypothetical protein